MKKNRKRLYICIGVIICLFLIGYLAMLKVVDNANKTEIQNLNMSNISDGEYVGTYKIFPVDVEVMVTVEQQRISKIDLQKHMNGLGKDAEAILDEVIKTQSLDIDSVSGATVSSKCILKAIEQAIVKENNNE